MATAATTPASTPKSIVNPKYRDKYKGEKNWLAKFIDAEATKTREVKVTKPNPANPDEKITTTENRAAGVDTKALFVLADKNGIDYANLKGHEDDHGFPGRARMTIGNGLRRVVKQRHGLYNKGGTFTSAPADFLAQIDAGDKPTHNQDGSKIAVAKPEAPAKVEGAEAPKAADKKPAAPKKK